MESVVCPGAQALRQAELLRGTLKSSVDDFNIGSSGWSSRQTLQDLYKSILLNDLEFALDKKVEQDLWNTAFKSQIDFLRQQAKENKGTRSSDIQAVLSLFLEAASGFYVQLLQEICLIYSLDLPGHTKSSHLGILQDDDVNKRPHTQSCYYVCQDCLVHLGDIARYCDDSNQAEVFYRHALVLVPSNGQPYNQLAILSSTRGDQLGTVYFYCRSIAVKNQFPAASTNLHKTFNKICSRSVLSSPTNKAEFFQLFIKFHALIYLDQEKGTFKQDDMLRMSAITLFTLYYVKSGKGADDLEEFDCISKAEEECWQLCLELAVNLFELSITYCIEDTEDNSVLLFVNVFCQWITGNSSTVWKEDLVKSELVWEKFATLVNKFSTVGNQTDKPVLDVPIYEDRELHCFIPLHSYQKKLNFAIKKERLDDEDQCRRHRLIQFANLITNHSPRVLSKIDDVVIGMTKFSLRSESTAEINGQTAQERPQGFPRSLGVDKIPHAPKPSFVSPKFAPEKSPSPTPFSETSSLFNNTHGAIGGRVERPSFLATPQVAQYSLFQSGWKAPLASAFGSPGTSQSSPLERTPTELSPIGQPLVNQGTQGNQFVNQGTLSINPGQPLVNQGPLSINPGQPLVNQGPLSINQGQPLVNQGPLSINPVQPLVNQGMLSINPGQPMANQGPLSQNSGQPLANQGTLSINPGQTLVNQSALPFVPGEYPPANSMQAFQSGPRPQGFSTPSPGALDGFGLSENWGSGVWGPTRNNNSPVAVHGPPQQVQSMWSQDLPPGQGLSPLQQLLHDQQNRSKEHNGT